jgi:hypothetical protein
MTISASQSPLGTRTENVYQFIKNYRNRHGYAPTRREIGRFCKLSTSVVNYHLCILQDAGRLTVARDVARGIVLKEDCEAPMLTDTVKEQS